MRWEIVESGGKGEKTGPGKTHEENDGKMSMGKALCA